MIIKARSISHIKSSLGYILKEEKQHEFLASDGLDTTNVKTMLSDFSIYQKEKVIKGYVSVVISPHQEDKLTIQEYRNLLKETLEELKLNNRQFIAVMHRNTDYPHIHVLLNRIDYKNNTWKDHHIAWKCQSACLSITKKLNLKNAYESTKKENKKTINNQYDKAFGELKKELQQIVKQELMKGKDLEHFYSHLESRGVKVEIEQFKNGSFGTTLEYKGVKFKASTINRKLSLQKNGDNYVPKAELQQQFDNNKAIQSGNLSEKEIMNQYVDDPNAMLQMLRQRTEQLTNENRFFGQQRSSEDDNEEDIKRKKRRAKERGR